MSCSSPNLAYSLGIDHVTGKRILKFAPKRADTNYRRLCDQYGVENVFLIPCGKCLGCRLDYRKEWSTRCMLEATLYDHCCFVTLTYDDAHVPGSLQKRDLQLFMKRLRKHYKATPIRFFASGELGTKNRRPHFHIILFGIMPEDIKVLGKCSSGEYTYTSATFSKLWPFGFHEIGEVTERSCSYVAGYVGKKVDDTGFVVMSNRPGIGAKYFEDHFHTIYVNDNIVMKNGQVVSVPRYCDILAERSGLDISTVINKRLDKMSITNNELMRSHGYRHLEMTFKDKLYKNEEKMKRLKRKL